MPNHTLDPPQIIIDPALTSDRDDHDLDVFFRPRSVAVIGATDKPGHVGRAILSNLLNSPFGGTVYPVNPKRTSVLGVRSCQSISQIPEPVDLAVVVTPAKSVPGVIEECSRSGVRGAVIISAGFREIGDQGVELEAQILAAAKRGKMRIVGPNCLGVMCPVTGLNATFANGIARRGTVALLSQSGAICTSLLDWSTREQIGFSAVFSTGSMIDIGWGALIDYLGDDPNTHSIVIYMESVGDVQSFLSAAREVALSKPILVIKAGRTELAAKAAASHTGALAGSDDVLDAAFRRVGILRINELSDVFQMTKVLAQQPLPKGPRLMIVTNAGGPGVLTTDALIAAGSELAPLSPVTAQKLDAVLPPHWSHANPIDLIGDAAPERYVKALEILTEDPECDGLLVVMTPQAMSDPTATAEKLVRFGHRKDKPLLTSWMGGESCQEGNTILNAAGIPTFPFPDAAARAFDYMWRYSYNLRTLYETPATRAETVRSAENAEALIETVRHSGRSLLTEFESKQLLASYGIPCVETLLASSESEAVAAAEHLGYPVVLKLNSFTITHKTNVGGVKLNLANPHAVREAFQQIQSSVAALAGSDNFLGVTVQRMIAREEGYELLLGSTVDKQFGPVLMFGLGGQLVEVFQDRAIGLPPLNTTLARRLMEGTKIYSALKGVRGRKPVNLAALEQLLVCFSELVAEQPWIQEMDINPLLASPDGLMVLDARVLLYPAKTDASQIIRPAIRAYPSKYIADVALSDGTALRIRPIRPEDEPHIVKFHASLSEQSVYNRYFSPLELPVRIRHERLTRICFIDYDREMALVAEQHRSGEVQEIIGVGRLIKSAASSKAELAVVVSDSFQKRGVGSYLTKHLIDFARDQEISLITASVLFENRPMQKLLESFGFVFADYSVQDGALKATLQL